MRRRERERRLREALDLLACESRRARYSIRRARPTPREGIEAFVTLVETIADRALREVYGDEPD